MNRGRTMLAIWWGASCLLGAATLAADGPTTDVAQFLKENDLEAYHAVCERFFTALVQARPEAATKILADSAGVPVEKLPEGMKRLAVQTAAKFNDGVIDVELVAASRVSGRVIALYFIAHTPRDPQLFVIMPYRRRTTWNTYFWAYEAEAAKILELLKGLPRFTGNTVLTLNRTDKAA